ncbi:MAG: tetratricopeptide repeat protein [Deltaproteobacteria bacterium]|nr:tetratricopeptide repeat protein [Deltaproteobacteria bacterium]
MTESISERHLSRLSVFVAARMGLHFPRERRSDLERAIGSAARELDFSDTESCIEWFLSSSSSRSHIKILASHLTIGETYFFRDRRVFEVLETQILPELIHSRRAGGKCIRIWSAGCATGEEPYSIAILLCKMIPDLQDWNITILATDINPRFLKKAAEGVYGQWSFRDMEPGIKERYFRQTKDGGFEILPHIKTMVTFSYLNLAEGPYPSFFQNTNAMDVIFCRNVLMYFVPELAKKVVRNLHRSLVNGGYLIVSPSESSHILLSQFGTVRFPGAIFYRKENQPVSAAEDVSCKPFEGPNIPFTPAVEFIPHRGVAPVSEARNMQLTSQSGDRDPQFQASNPNPEAQLRHELYRKALSLFETGCYAEAIKKTEDLLSQYPSSARGMALLARIHANSGQLDKALEWCERAIAAEKLNTGFHYLMATILLELRRTEDATLSFKRTLYLDPNFIMAYVALGSISRQHGRHKEAAKHFENALLLLSAKPSDGMLPESEGITAGRLTEIIQVMQRAKDREVIS